MYSYFYLNSGNAFPSYYGYSQRNNYSLLPAYQSYVVVFYPKVTGNITVRGYASDPGTSANKHVKMFISHDFQFNEANGELTSYEYLVEGEYTASKTYDVTAGSVWYVLITGFNTLPIGSNYNDTIFIQYNSYVFAEKTRTAITDFHGETEIRDYFTCSYTEKIPFTAKYNGQVEIHESGNDSSRFNIVITTQDSGINTTTGMPNASDVSYASAYGRYWNAVAGTQYYIYIANTQYSETFKNYKLCTGGHDNYYGFNAQVKDLYGRTCGSYRKKIIKNYLILSDINRMDADHWIYWYPDNINFTDPYDSHVYKYAHFLGWYTDPSYSYESFLSSDPAFIYAPSANNITLYGLVELTDTDFAWDCTVSSGSEMLISSSNWNHFVSYAMQKKLKTSSITEPVVDMTGSYNTQSAFTGNSQDIFYAHQFNYVKNILGITSIADLSSGNIIYASHMNTLLNTAKGL